MRLPARLTAWLYGRCFDLTQRRFADELIGGPVRPYLLRWWIVRTRVLSIYVHEFRRSDDDRALHDHPWANVSLVLKNGYTEVLPNAWTRDVTGRLAPSQDTHRVPRAAGDIVVRAARAAHRIELTRVAVKGPDQFWEYPAWSLFIAGPHTREWGFWCPQGWRHWRAFVAPGDTGTTGRGCA